MPPLVLQRPVLHDLPQAVHICGYDSQRDRPNEPFLAMRPYLVQSAMVQIIDRRLNARMLPARRCKRWRALPHAVRL